MRSVGINQHQQVVIDSASQVGQVAESEAHVVAGCCVTRCGGEGAGMERTWGVWNGRGAVLMIHYGMDVMNHELDERWKVEFLSQRRAGNITDGEEDMPARLR